MADPLSTMFQEVAKIGGGGLTGIAITALLYKYIFMKPTAAAQAPPAAVAQAPPVTTNPGNPISIQATEHSHQEYMHKDDCIRTHKDLKDFMGVHFAAGEHRMEALEDAVKETNSGLKERPCALNSHELKHAIEDVIKESTEG